MKIGIMGGTFNPIHIGHMLLAQFAYEDYELDEIWFLPNGNPPHKRTADETEEALSHRVEMVRKAICDVPYFKLCLHEADSNTHSYTYQTLQELTALYPEHKFYFILGADSLFSIEHWKCFQKIFPNCVILAAMRDVREIRDMETQISYLKEKYGARIELLMAPLIDISSTGIRARASQGLSVYYMVPDTVAEYIRDNRLYAMKPEARERETRKCPLAVK